MDILLILSITFNHLSVMSKIVLLFIRLNTIIIVKSSSNFDKLTGSFLRLEEYFLFKSWNSCLSCESSWQIIVSSYSNVSKDFNALTSEAYKKMKHRKKKYMNEWKNMTWVTN